MDLYLSICDCCTKSPYARVAKAPVKKIDREHLQVARKCLLRRLGDGQLDHQQAGSRPRLETGLPSQAVPDKAAPGIDDGDAILAEDAAGGDEVLL
jgi:hypothetical protein